MNASMIIRFKDMERTIVLLLDKVTQLNDRIEKLEAKPRIGRPPKDEKTKDDGR